MWSMGITLYVLTFFVNPFSDIEDTIQGPLAFPQLVSEGKCYTKYFKVEIRLCSGEMYLLD